MSEERIAQFQKMAEADPDNELGHFSLGKALLDAGRADEAISSFQRALEINPENSKVFQLLASAQGQAGQKDEAIATLTKGYEIADRRGDLMPRNQMGQMLKDLGQPVPESLAAGEAVEPMDEGPPEGRDDLVLCSRYGKWLPKLQERPFKGPLGEEILEKVSAQAWQEWIPMGTKVINELRLDFSNPEHAEVYDQHMREFLGLQ
jgi:Fe-S cluster biosynthesis and repair protein YggX